MRSVTSNKGPQCAVTVVCKTVLSFSHYSLSTDRGLMECIGKFGGFWLLLLTASVPFSSGMGVGESVSMWEREMEKEGYLA